jgi:hypothetical protein
LLVTLDVRVIVLAFYTKVRIVLCTLESGLAEESSCMDIIMVLYGSRAVACKSLSRFLLVCDALCKKTARWSGGPWMYYCRASGYCVLDTQSCLFIYR